MKYVHYMVLLLMFLLSGCASSGNPAVLDQAAVGQIKEGVSTKEDVSRLLGKPNTMGRGAGTLPGVTSLPLTLQGNYEVWIYQHVSVETDAATFIPIVGLVAGGATAQTTSLTLYFNEKGVVQYLQTSSSESHSGMGSPSSGKTWTPPDSY